MFVTRELYGGTITALTPPDLFDASDVRQVPDNQEVFLYPDSDVSIIVEILQKVEPASLDDAIKFHFYSLANDNSARSSEIASVDNVRITRDDDTPYPVVLHGVQLVPKFNQRVPDRVKISMALFRIESKSIDLVVTFNIPEVTLDGGATGEIDRQKAEEDFNTFVTSLRIIDFGLFA